MMEHFRVLPTDERARELSDLQISLLMQYWLDYDEDNARRSYREDQSRKKAKPQFNENSLRELGYSDEEIRSIVGGVK